MKLLELKSLARLLVLVVLLLSCSGCLTCYNLTRVGSNSDTIVVTTEPTGAEVYYHGKYMGTTPCNIYIDLKAMTSTDFVAIWKDNRYYGHLQISEVNEAGGNKDTRLMYMCLDACTIVPFLVDLVCLIPTKIIKHCQYDSYDYTLVYKNRCISLCKIKSEDINDVINKDYWRVISPYDDLYGEIKKENIFCGWKQNGTYSYTTPAQEYMRKMAELERQQAMANAVVSGMNQFSQQMQRNTAQYQPAPPPIPRPTPAPPAQASTQRTVMPAPKPYQREVRPSSFNVGTNPDGSMKVSDQEWRDRKK